MKKMTRGRVFPQSGKRQSSSPWLAAFIYGLALTMCMQPVYTRTHTAVRSTVVVADVSVIVGSAGSICKRSAFGCCRDKSTLRLDRLGTNCIGTDETGFIRRKPLTDARRSQLRAERQEGAGARRRLARQDGGCKVSVYTADPSIAYIIGDLFMLLHRQGGVERCWIHTSSSHTSSCM